MLGAAGGLGHPRGWQRNTKAVVHGLRQGPRRRSLCPPAQGLRGLPSADDRLGADQQEAVVFGLRCWHRAGEVRGVRGEAGATGAVEKTKRWCSGCASGQLQAVNLGELGHCVAA